MEGSGTRNKGLRRAEVTLNIEMRPATAAQLEAGKRLFSMFLANARRAGQGDRVGTGSEGCHVPLQTPLTH